MNVNLRKYFQIFPDKLDAFAMRTIHVQNKRFYFFTVVPVNGLDELLYQCFFPAAIGTIKQQIGHFIHRMIGVQLLNNRCMNRQQESRVGYAIGYVFFVFLNHVWCVVCGVYVKVALNNE